MTDSSHAVTVKKTGKATERMIFEADAIEAMVNEDGSITFILHNENETVDMIVRISKGDVERNERVFKRWGKQ